MLQLSHIHHIAIIATDYARSKAFYYDVLGFTLMGEYYREARDSWKGDLALKASTPLSCSLFPCRRHASAILKPAACAI
nr:Lysine decarboxylase, constitutive [Candidatus Pantoea persica]